MPLGNDIDELLTGYIDGQLTDDERRLIETAIQEDRAVALRLQQLRKLSQELHSLGQQTHQRLSSDFTDRVLARCLDESSRSEVSLPTSDWNSEVALPDWKRSNRRTALRVMSALAALAGTIAIAVWLPQWGQRETVINPIADLSHSEKNAVEPNSAGEPNSVDLLASSESTGGETSSMEVPAFPKDGVMRDSSLQPMSPELADASGDGSAVGADNRNSLDAGQLASQNPGGSPISFILVLDLELSRLAAEQDVLRSLLAKYGISPAFGVTLNSEIEKAIGRMRFSVPENQNTESAELLLVRAPSAVLDAALSELEGEVDLIPGYRFDLAFQTPSVSLSQAILDSVEVELSESEALAIAVVADKETSQSVQIDAIPYQGTLISTGRRRERLDSFDELPASSDLSYLLILVRHQ